MRCEGEMKQDPKMQVETGRNQQRVSRRKVGTGGIGLINKGVPCDPSGDPDTG